MCNKLRGRCEPACGWQYRPHAPEADREALRERRSQAWQVAREAAALLKSRYHARRVVVFGSLTRADRFNRWSDVDLAAWGLAPEDYFEAVARVLDVVRLGQADSG